MTIEMSIIILIAKFICLLLCVVYGFSNIAKVFWRQSVSSVQILLMGFGFVGFVFLQWII